MKRIFISSLLLAIIFSGCNKTDTPCQNCNSNCSHKSGDITGNWILQKSKFYSAPGNQNPDWVNADANKPVTIEFKNDSLFYFNDNYLWKEQQYDRYKIIDSADFIIYSSTPFLSHQVLGKILNSKEIELTYMGVDTGAREMYACH